MCLDSADCSRIWPTWFCNPFCLLSWEYCGLRDTFVAFQSVSSSMKRIFLDHIIRSDTLINCRFLSEDCRHLPQIQKTMPTSQKNKQSWHCTLEVHISKYSVFPKLRVNSFVFSLNRLNFLVLFFVCLQRFAIWVCLMIIDFPTVPKYS